MLEPAALVRVYAGVYERHGVGKELMDALLLVQIFDDGRVSAGETLESFFAARIGKTSAIEDESAAVPGFINGHATMKGETEDPHAETLRFRGDLLQFF